ncbi:MAG: methyltransferase domain-containing protein [Candidatus Shapirobacteria bacterium]|jgi:predicted SAM-dependent methyltransferase
MKKINIGSGPISAKGWINYDWGLLPFLGKYRLTSIFVKAVFLPKSYDWKWPCLELVDIRSEWPVPDSTVDFVFCSQVLEHFNLDEGEEIIKQVFRVLKNGGKLRLSIPDLKKISEFYLEEGKVSETNEILWGYKKQEYRGILGKIKLFFVRGHKWFYDKRSIEELLKNNGFTKIKFFERTKGSVPDLDKLELKEHEKTSLYLEAVKSV